MKINNIKKYLGEYHVEGLLFNTIGPRAKKRLYLNFDEFYKICMWKSPRPKKYYLSNKNTVRKITRKSFSLNDDLLKIKELCKLNGIGMPTASAILTVVFPDKFGIIDVRCLEELNNLGHKIKISMSPKTWLEYIEIIRSLAKENNVTPREIDMVLFAMHREKQGDKNLYN